MGPIRPRKELKTMNNKMLIGGEIVNDTCLVLFAAMNDELYRPAVVLSISLDGGIGTIDTLGFAVSVPDSIRVGDVPLVKTDSSGYSVKYILGSCALQAHTIDVSKAGWSAGVNVYEWAGLTDWRDPKYKRLRSWKHAWWQLVVDLFDLDMDI